MNSENNPNRVNIVNVSNVSKRFGEHYALCDLTFDVHRGDVLGLIGPNGAGKTTIVRLLLGLLQPDSGVVSVFGQTPSRTVLRKVGYLPEERGLYQRDRVNELIRYFARLRGASAMEAKAKTDLWLDRLELRNLAPMQVGQLSKGNQQRVQLATVLVSDPELIILDEPLSGLDPIGRDIFVQTIKSLVRTGVTFIISTHAMELVEFLCNKVLMVANGRRIFYGTPAEAQIHSTQRFVVCCSIDLRCLSMVDTVEEHEDGNLINLKAGFSSHDLMSAILSAGGEISYFSNRAESMQDIFINLIKESAVADQ